MNSTKQFVVAFIIGVAIAWLLLSLVENVLAATPEETLTVSVTDAGPQPASCTVKRSDNVRWRNDSSQPIRVIGVNNARLDTGDVVPGEVSGAFSFDFIGSVKYNVLGFDGWVRTTDVGNPHCDPLEPSGYRLASGWNLVVWKGPDLPAGEIEGALPGATTIYQWNGEAQEWERLIPGAPEYVSSIEFLVTGRAYWVKLP